MKKNNSIIFSTNKKFLSPSSEKKIIKITPNHIISRNTRKINDYKVNQEIKSLPKDLGRNLKKVLSKIELSHEIYIPKNIPLNIQYYNKNLLINKVQDYEKFIYNKNKINSKLHKNNSSFLKVYNHIKELESSNNKISRQEEFLNDIERTYSNKGYNMDDLKIRKGENIFNYSILNDRKFGNNIKEDAFKILNQLDNHEMKIEPNFIFNLNTKLFNRKLKFNFKSGIKKKGSLKDYGFELMNKKDEKFINKFFGYKKRKSIINEQSLLNKKLKDDIDKIMKNLEDIKNNYQNNHKYKTPTKYVNFLEKKFDSSSPNNNPSDNKNNQNNLILITIEEGKDNKKNKNLKNQNSSNNISIFKKKTNFLRYKSGIINFNVENYFSDIKLNSTDNLKDLDSRDSHSITRNEFPLINTSYEKSRNANLVSTKSTNLSINKNEPKKNSIISNNRIKTEIEQLKDNNITKNKSLSNILNSENSLKKPIKINNITSLKRKKITVNSIPYLKTFLNEGEKKIITDKELNYYILEFKKKNSSLLKEIKKNKIKESNLHEIIKNFQNVSKRGNFSYIFENSNKNFTHLLTNVNENIDEKNAMNLKEIDKKISNIHYDFAEFLINN